MRAGKIWFQSFLWWVFILVGPPVFADHDSSPGAPSEAGERASAEKVLNQVKLNRLLVELFPATPINADTALNFGFIHQAAVKFTGSERSEEDRSSFSKEVSSAIESSLNDPALNIPETARFFQDSRVLEVLGMVDAETQALFKAQLYLPRVGLINDSLTQLFQESVVRADQLAMLTQLSGRERLADSDFDERAKAIMGDPSYSWGELRHVFENSSLAFALGLTSEQRLRFKSLYESMSDRKRVRAP